MAETKDEIAADRDRLRLENEQLRGSLAASGVGPRVQQPAHTFQLSEGQRQELVMNGYTNVNGVLRTRAEVQAMLGDAQAEVDLGEGDPPAGTPAMPPPRSEIRGVDYVYPSTRPGFIDPTVAGLPGVNGPADPKTTEK